jgi:ribosomal protein S18 acetylase RimI-like enzyme
MENVNIEIVDFRSEHQPWFEQLNRGWIEKYFWMEPVDAEVLQNPQRNILDKGGYIFMAYCNREIAGTVALKFVRGGVYEFTKMAVDEKFRGKHIGKTLAYAAIERARSLGADKIILYSNTILTTAIALYRKLGFKEVSLDGPYKRSNIKMELALEKADVTVRKANLDDVDAITSLGIQTFKETFEAVNTEENMKMYLDTTFTAEKIKNEFSETGSVFFIAERNHHPIGFAKVRTSRKPSELNGYNAIEIERLYALKSEIGKGVGRKLMQTCLQFSKDSGYELVWLGVWEHNHRGIEFYQKFGFEKFGQHVFMLGTDAQTDFLFQKKL